jgi:hypothetical protein
VEMLEKLEKVKSWVGQLIELGLNEVGEVVIVEPLGKPSSGGFVSASNVSNNSNDADEDVINIKGKQFITYKGLLKLGHNKGIKEFIILDQFVNAEMTKAWAKVRLIAVDGSVWDGFGSSTPDNTNKMTSNHPIEMAHTRAKGRALRDFLNVGVAMVEELKDNSDEVVEEDV